MNGILDAFAPLAVTQIWQVAAVVLTAALVTRVPAVRQRPHLAYALWLLVLVKCLTPPLVASPTSPFSWALARGSEPVTVVTAPSATLEDEVVPMPLDHATPPFPAAEAMPIAVAPREHVQNQPAVAVQQIRPEPAAATTVPSWNLPAVLAITWLTGTALFAVVSLGRYWRTRRRLMASATANALPVEETITDLCGMLRIRRRAQAIVTDQSFGPAVLGLWRPVIVVPQSAQSRLSPDRLRLVLAHELIHLRRGDHWTGLAQFLVQSIWWFHPLVWWACRETNRVREQCCDEEVVAGLRCPPADYAQTLLDIVRFAARSRPIALATGVSALHVTQRRLQHIMTNASRFHSATPRGNWLAAALAALLLLPGAGLALDDPKVDGDGGNGKDSRRDEISYTGQLFDHETNQPIHGATLTILRHTIGENHAEGPRTSSTTETDSNGRYQFTFPRQELAGDRLFVVRGFQHPDYIGRMEAGFFRDPAKNVTKHDLNPVKLAQGAFISGRLETPEGDPAVGVRGYVLITPDKDKQSLEMPPRYEIRTGVDGRFRFNAFRDGGVVLSFAPDRFASVTRDLGQQRGDIGRIRLTPGVRVTGTVRDLEGKPVAGVWVNFVMDEVVLRIRLRPDRVSRAALTNAEGEYQLDPIPAGRYRVMVQDRSWDDRHETEHVGEPLKAAFPTGTYFTSITKGWEVLPIVAVRDVSLHVRFFDNLGKPARSGPVLIEGTFRGQPYLVWGRLDSEGKVNAKAPRGLEKATILATGRPDQTRHYRRGKSGALHDGPKWNLGTLNEDVTDLEVVISPRVVPPERKGETSKKGGEDATDARSEPTEKDSEAKAPDAPDDEAKAEPEEQFYDHPITVTGKALDPDAKPIAGATIYLVSTNVSKDKLLGETKTDADGRYEFRDKQLPIRVATEGVFGDQGSFEVFGKAPGRAFAWQGMKHLHVGPRLPGVALVGPGNYYPGQKIELDLTFEQPQTIAGRIVDETGRPISGVKVHLEGCDYLDRTGRERDDNDDEFWAMDQAVDIMPELLRSTTDADGRFAFGSAPPNVYCRIYVEHPKYAHLSLYASTAANPPAHVEEGQPVSKLPLDITLREVRSIPIQVVSAVSGRPVPRISVTGYQNPRGASGTSAYGTTDKQGNVTLRLPPGEYKLVADPPHVEDKEGFVRTYQQLVVKEEQAEQPTTLKMDQGCMLVLRAVDADTGNGIPGVTFWYEGDKPGSRWSVQTSPSFVDNPKTDAKGELRAIVLPGKRLYGVGFGPLPKGYRLLKSEHLGRELELPAGFEVVSEFKLHKANAKPAQKELDKSK